MSEISTEVVNKKTKKIPFINAQRRETLMAYLFLLPSLFFFVTFVIAPILMGLVTSMFNYTNKKFEFTGLENYIKLFNNEIFLKSLGNTIKLVVIAVPIIVIFSLDRKSVV